MSDSQPPISPREVVALLAFHWRRWVYPGLAMMLLAAGYAWFRPATWEASQALVLRNEAANNVEGLGRFRHLDDMKITQETVLEIAKSRRVLGAALRKVGPPSGAAAPAGWPRVEDVLELRDAVALVPPKGTEFGKTEIFYLKVKARDRQRAVALASAVCEELQAGLGALRRTKAQSMIDELARAAALAEADLQASNEELGRLEQEVGSDLGELRMLDLSATGDSDLRRKLATIENELRETRTALRAADELLKLLHEAQDDAGRLIATPHRLLESQPALRRLKEGLVDAQLRSAQLLATMTTEHPMVKAARIAEQEVRQQLHDELDIAVRGVELDRRLAADRLAVLQAEQDILRERLDRLAGLRARYSTLAAAVRHRMTLVERAQKDLADARASQAAANSASLLTVVDQPETGNNPVGPSRSMIVLAGLVGGLATSLGLVFLTTGPLPASAWSLPRTRDNSPEPLDEAHIGLSLQKALAPFLPTAHSYR